MAVLAHADAIRQGSGGREALPLFMSYTVLVRVNMSTAPAPRMILPRAVADELRALGERCGVRDIRVFGSFARGEAAEGSDLDLLVDYVPGQSGFAFFRFCREVEQLVGRKVDVATQESLHPLIRDRVLAEAIPL